MANDIRDFDFKSCPWFNAKYRDSHVLKVQQDQVGICRVFLRCDGCGTVYRADRKVVWEAEVIGKTEELNVADFMEDRDRRINKALTDRHKKPGSDREAE